MIMSFRTSLDEMICSVGQWSLADLVESAPLLIYVFVWPHLLAFLYLDKAITNIDLMSLFSYLP